MPRWCTTIALILCLVTLASITRIRADEPVAAKERDIYARDNLVAWCIVPFDGKKRGPAERAAMCARLGLKKIAYDWRQEHVATFEEEIRQYQKHGLEYFAFWGQHEDAFRLFEKYDLHPQIWIMLPAPKATTQQERVKEAAAAMLPLVQRTRQMRCKVGLYNHGGWHGEPENLIAVCRYLRENHDADHVGIVYNQHHAHDRIDDFGAVVKQLLPYLHCLNLNGMTREGDKRGQKILPLGEGEMDVALLKAIRDAGYRGPIGIIGHTQDDVEQRLQDNLDGLEWIRPQLDSKRPGPKPKLRTWSPDRDDDSPLSMGTGVLLEGNAAYRQPPLTVEARVVFPSRERYNIIVASDSKASGAHWEIFTVAGSGMFSAYTPGLNPDHTHSQAMLCDGKPHNVTMTYAKNRVQLSVDDKLVADQAVSSAGRPAVPGGLGIGRLVRGDLSHTGSIQWVRISRGLRKTTWAKAEPPARDEATLLLWTDTDTRSSQQSSPPPTPNRLFGPTPEYSPQLVQRLLAGANNADATRGLMQFADSRLACLNCHQIGTHGGSIGPALTEIAKQRKPHEIVESLVWPQRHVRPEYQTQLIVTDDGVIHKGYLVKEDSQTLVLRDVTTPAQSLVTLQVDAIDERETVGTMMPDNLLAALSNEQVHHLLAFLLELGRTPAEEDQLAISQIESVLEHAVTHAHGAAPFEYEKAPIDPQHWPNAGAHVNRDRIYQFYLKEARYFRGVGRQGEIVPAVLADFPGLDGGVDGHWGNQNEETWASGAWNDVKLGSLLSAVFRGQGVTVPRGVCLQLGDEQEMSVCFNPDTLSYDMQWTGGFVTFSSVRHGFMHGATMAGKPVGDGRNLATPRPTKPYQYKGFYRLGPRVAFRYEIDGVDYLDAPWVEDGKFVRERKPLTEHSLADKLPTAPRQWTPLVLPIELNSSDGPYTVDTLRMPMENPWNIPMFGGGVACDDDGTVFVCTMHGDVWRVENSMYPSREARWVRFASGMHHCQGMHIDRDGIFVIGRNQLTRLHDLNGDGEADYYECYSDAFETSPAGHDFICGLVRDDRGNFYTASGNQGIVRISPDGQSVAVVATGFRNPDGIGITSDGVITVPCSEGGWTPASMVCAFHAHDGSRPYFGFGGPRDGNPPALPLAYLPRGLDNSAGGQTEVTSDRWGPLSGQLLHFSFGTGSHFLLLRDEVDSQMQGAVVPLAGDFLSGIHRGSFNPKDGQLYVTGMQGWGSYTPQHGCLQRVRFTGKPVQLPTGIKTYRNGVLIQFSAPLDPSVAGDAANHFAQCWNYRYSSAYGSREYSTRHFGMPGHDHLQIKSAHVVNDGRSLFLGLPDLQPVNQLHLLVRTGNGPGIHGEHELFATIHTMRDESFTDAPGLVAMNHKLVLAHPIVADLAMATRKVDNPFAVQRAAAQEIRLETGTNLTFTRKTLRVPRDSTVQLTLVNPDVVPHNWVLVKPGTLRRVGEAANRLISDPDAAVRQYIPQSSDVLAYTDIVLPGQEFTIYFETPDQPGRYPFLCTFPGHWLVMNGEMIVE